MIEQTEILGAIDFLCYQGKPRITLYVFNRMIEPNFVAILTI
ncbi:hypothetical protein [Dactylococcopsis salina]|nr:hypothetical protein [Dactylococcopsis salina]